MPTPADLAGHPRRPLTARPVVTADLTAPFRQRWETGIRYSGLHRTARLVGLTIATYADWQTGLIAAPAMPGVPRLSKAAGLLEIHVRTSLQALIGAGWIERTAGRSTAHPGVITLLIPPTARTRE